MQTRIHVIFFVSIVTINENDFEKNATNKPSSISEVVIYMYIQMKVRQLLKPPVKN